LRTLATPEPINAAYGLERQAGQDGAKVVSHGRYVVFHTRRYCKKAGKGRLFTPIRNSSGESRLERLDFQIGALTMKKRTGEHATAAYSPKEGHSVVVYTHKFKPEHFREGVEIVTNQFADAQAEIGQKRHNIFLKRPSTHEIVNISFFDEGAGVHDWHESEGRLTTVKKLQGMLEKPVDVQVFEVAGVVGISD
jgi:hypothetical protein